MLARVKWVLLSLLAISFFVLGGCGDDEDACAGVSCEVGVCDSSTGQCSNPAHCEIDNDCVAGYTCGDDYQCEALNECADDSECGAGECRGGACVNPSSCSSNDDCLDRSYCGRGDVCRPDPCNDISCQRGVCLRGTDQCVSADSCTPATEVVDCVAGEKCADGSCEAADSFCDDITCERGVCSFDAGGCANADNCEGDSANCAEGFYCNDQDQCQPDLCERNSVECPAGGVCIASAGECQNATSCSSNDDCLANHLCVEGSCRLGSVACGDAGGDGGCPGNQVCEFDDTDLSATCAEPEVCKTSLDCHEDRQCGGRTCLDEVACEDDHFEPNDSAGEATIFADVAQDNTLSASLCGADVDHYAFDTTDLIAADQRGQLVVEVDVPARDVGLGQLDVVLLDDDGSELASGSTGARGADSSVRLLAEVRIPTHGQRSIEVRAGDDVSAAGVRYNLSVNIVPEQTFGACEDATPIRINQRISGTTANSSSNFLGSSCTSNPNPENEVVYALDIDAPQEVSFHLTPQLSSADLSMSLRSKCLQASSEQACVNAGADGEEETLTALLGAGTHYLVVQAPENGTGGPFELVVQTIYTACSAGDDYCEDAQTARACTPDGGRFTSIGCESGCNPTDGRCFPPPGDVCLDAEVIDADTSVAIDLVQVNNNYAISGGECLGGADMVRTEGPEQSFLLEIPADKVVTATVQFANEVDGSLYIVEDCGDVNNTCIDASAPAATNPQTLTYSNLSGADMSTYLIVDTAPGQVVGGAQLTVSYEDVVCTPDEQRCDGTGSVVEQCDEFGREYVDFDECGQWECTSGACDRPNTCANALDLTTELAGGNVVSITDDWTNFTSEVNTDLNCGLTSGAVAGEDVFLNIDLEEGDRLQATASSTGVWPSLVLFSDCSDPANSCLAGEAPSSTNELIYSSPSDQTVTLVLSHDDFGTKTSFNVDVEVVPTDCDPSTFTPTCADSFTAETCEGAGYTTQTSCPGGCNSGVCGDNDTCADAYDVTADASQSGGVTITGGWDDYSNTYEDYPSCSVSDTASNGHDLVYAVTLNDGQTLTADVTSTGIVWSRLLVVTDCSDVTGSCVDAAAPSSATANLTYTASADETIYLVVDNDWPTAVGEQFTLTLEIQ